MATAQLGSLLRYVRELAAGQESLPRTDHQLLEDFSARRDETAFAALVARHGPMMLPARPRNQALEHAAQGGGQPDLERCSGRSR
jgi:hypothetical protein